MIQCHTRILFYFAKKNGFFFNSYIISCVYFIISLLLLFLSRNYISIKFIFFIFPKFANNTFINFERKAYLNFSVFSHIYISFTRFLIIINRYIVLALFNIIIFSVLSTFFLFLFFICFGRRYGNTNNIQIFPVVIKYSNGILNAFHIRNFGNHLHLCFEKIFQCKRNFSKYSINIHH